MYDPFQPLGEQDPVDYTDFHNAVYGTDALCVQAVGTEMLKLWELDEPRSVTTFDRIGRRRRVTATHEIGSYTLSTPARKAHDDFAGVKFGPDTGLLTKTEARPILAEIKKPGGSMFRCVQLFP